MEIDTKTYRTSKSVVEAAQTKSSGFTILFAVVCLILCNPALGAIELPKTDESPTDWVNPVLAGIEQLYVVVIPPDADPNKDGLVFADLETQVKEKLRQARIKVISAIKPGQEAKALEIPELRVRIFTLKLEKSLTYVYKVQTSLAAKVYLPGTPRRALKAEIWKIGTTIGATTIENMPSEVTNWVTKQVDSFIDAYTAANKNVEKPLPRHAANTASQKTQDSKNPQLSKPVSAEYEFVASKNSKVFHKPDCSSAKNIKAENLVGYKTRKEAIDAGKRPCKKCKP